MARFRSAVSCERGFSFPELIVATLIGLIVAGGAMTVVTTMVRAQPELTQRAGQIQQGRTMLERITRELRQGNSVTNATASGMRIQTYVDGADCGGTPGVTKACWITYACGSTSCTRTPDGQAAETVVSGISGPNIFCYGAWSGEAACAAPTATDPDYVAMRLSFPQDNGDEAITLDNGITLRNA